MGYRRIDFQLFDSVLPAWGEQNAETAVVRLEAQHTVKGILHLRLAGVFPFPAAAACNPAVKDRVN